MGNNTITRKKRKRIWPIEIIAGLFIMMIVFFIAVKYSLQGTTQGRYLTGGVPPVRFSM